MLCSVKACPLQGGLKYYASLSFIQRFHCIGGVLSFCLSVMARDKFWDTVASSTLCHKFWGSPTQNLERYPVLACLHEFLQCVTDSRWAKEHPVNSKATPWSQLPDETVDILLDIWVWLCGVTDQCLQSQASMPEGSWEGVSLEVTAREEQGAPLV